MQYFQYYPVHYAENRIEEEISLEDIDALFITFVENLSYAPTSNARRGFSELDHSQEQQQEHEKPLESLLGFDAHSPSPQLAAPNTLFVFKVFHKRHAFVIINVTRNDQWQFLS